jgi:hypothetical protein
MGSLSTEKEPLPGIKKTTKNDTNDKNKTGLSASDADILTSVNSSPTYTNLRVNKSLPDLNLNNSTTSLGKLEEEDNINVPKTLSSCTKGGTFSKDEVDENGNASKVDANKNATGISMSDTSNNDNTPDGKIDNVDSKNPYKETGLISGRTDDSLLSKRSVFTIYTDSDVDALSNCSTIPGGHLTHKDRFSGKSTLLRYSLLIEDL